MDQKPPASRWKTAVLITLLALLCIGGAELVACRFADPALYHRITAPVVRQFRGLRASLASLRPAPAPSPTPEAEPPQERQYAGDPAIWADLSADPAVTRLEERDGREILTGGAVEVPYFNQADPAWCEQSYGTDTIGKYGCGPTAMAMAVGALTGEAPTPAALAAWASENGHWASGSGSRLSIVEGAAAAYGLDAQSCTVFEADRLLQELSAGKLGVALVRAGHFTQGGHFILLRGATLDGGVLVADPNSRERSLSVWDPQLILDELSASRSDGAPLWFLSPAQPGLEAG